MANREFVRDGGALERGLVTLFAHITFGSSGAPTLVRRKGIASIARDQSVAGKYTLTLENAYQRVLFLGAMFVETDAPAAPFVRILEDNVATASAPTIVFQCSDADTPAATDPASGEKLLLQIVLSNSAAF